MGRQELVAALQHKAAQESQAIWQAAEAAAAQAEAAAATELARLATSRQQLLLQQEQRLQQQLARQVHRRLQRARLRAQARLARRLETLGQQLLQELPAAERSAAWQRLAAELPDYPWATIRVHATDCAAARQRFPSSQVQADAAVSGGLIVESEDAAIRIDNSFEGRKERLWPRLVGALYAELEAELESGDDPTVA